MVIILEVSKARRIFSSEEPQKLMKSLHSITYSVQSDWHQIKLYQFWVAIAHIINPWAAYGSFIFAVGFFIYIVKTTGKLIVWCKLICNWGNKLLIPWDQDKQFLPNIMCPFQFVVNLHFHDIRIEGNRHMTYHPIFINENCFGDTQRDAEARNVSHKSLALADVRLDLIHLINFCCKF